ncbi:MAG TPA: hypothetical protein PKJ23_03925, partial [bacterium]|nr:hypothetical protein [bacterium]
MMCPAIIHPAMEKCPAKNRRAIIASSEGRTTIDHRFNGGHHGGHNGGYAPDAQQTDGRTRHYHAPALKCRAIIASSEGRTTIDHRFN